MSENRYDCAECGQNVSGTEFHDFGCCVLYKADHKKPLTDQDRRYLQTLGLMTLRKDTKAAQDLWAEAS